MLMLLATTMPWNSGGLLGLLVNGMTCPCPEESVVTATSKLFIFFFHNKIPSSHLHTRKEMKVVPNRLPPTMPLWHNDYSELETTEKK